MRVSIIHYERLKNLGNYENEKVGVDIALMDGEDIDKAVEWAKSIVNDALGIDEKSKADVQNKEECPF